MLTDFQNSFTSRLSSKISHKEVIKYPTTPQTRRYTSLLPCEIVVFKNRNGPGINCVKRTAMQDLASFLFTDEKIFTVAAPKNLQND